MCFAIDLQLIHPPLICSSHIYVLAVNSPFGIPQAFINECSKVSSSWDPGSLAAFGTEMKQTQALKLASGLNAISNSKTEGDNRQVILGTSQQSGAFLA